MNRHFRYIEQNDESQGLGVDIQCKHCNVVLHDSGIVEGFSPEYPSRTLIESAEQEYDYFTSHLEKHGIIVKPEIVLDDIETGEVQNEMFTL